MLGKHTWSNICLSHQLVFVIVVVVVVVVVVVLFSSYLDASLITSFECFLIKFSFFFGYYNNQVIDCGQFVPL